MTSTPETGDAERRDMLAFGIAGPLGLPSELPPGFRELYRTFSVGVRVRSIREDVAARRERGICGTLDIVTRTHAWVAGVHSVQPFLRRAHAVQVPGRVSTLYTLPDGRSVAIRTATLRYSYIAPQRAAGPSYRVLSYVVNFESARQSLARIVTLAGTPGMPAVRLTPREPLVAGIGRTDPDVWAIGLVWPVSEHLPDGEIRIPLRVIRLVLPAEDVRNISSFRIAAASIHQGRSKWSPRVDAWDLIGLGPEAAAEAKQEADAASVSVRLPAGAALTAAVIECDHAGMQTGSSPTA